MASKKRTQFSYLPDPDNSAEYWIFGYNPEKPGDNPELIETKPFGEMFARFIDLDDELFVQIRSTLERFASVENPEDYINGWQDFRDDVWKLGAVTEKLPPVFIDFITVLDYFFKEYLTNLMQKPSLSHADIEKMARGAQILRDYCDRISARKALLTKNILGGNLAPGKPGLMHETLTTPGNELIIDCNLQARCIFIDSKNQRLIKLCYEAGADLAGFITAFMLALSSGGLGVVPCGNCGKPFVTSGRSVYCGREATGGSCRAVGAIAKYNRRLSENPDAASFRREYKKLYAQMAKGVITREQFEQWKASAMQK